tara:strand:+ start:32194 stop:32955 length:762 start_codon:yes stop_codon:yes gene_type:complete
MDYKETNVFKSYEYDVEITGDGSPTLRYQRKESMHNRRGAAGESVYIYYHALLQYAELETAKKMNHELRVLSLGFGLGYNEIATVMCWLKNKWNLEKLELVSYEKDLFLYELFNAWLIGPSDSKSVFDDVFVGMETALNSFPPAVPLSDLKTAMIWLLENKKWMQAGLIKSVDDFDGYYDVVFFDAFSSKVDSCLWTEEFLNEFVKTRLNSTFVLSTYACTGALRRVAANNRAQFVKRIGYKGKRNASLIFRI